MPLNVAVLQKDSNTYVISPDGSIDANTQAALRSQVEALLQRSAKFIVFDMARVHFVDSAGVGVVLTAEKALKSQGGMALIVNPQPQIKKVFDIIRALPSSQVFSSVREMDDYLSAIQRKVIEGEME